MNKLNIGYLSDLHLEQVVKILLSNAYKKNRSVANWALQIPRPKIKLDVLVIAGDSCESRFEPLWHHLFSIVTDYAKVVIVIPGNHEYWESNDVDAVRDIRSYADQFPNITVLDNESVIVDDVSFFGTVLWSNYDGRKDLAERLDPKRGSSRHKDRNFSKIKLYNSGRRRLSYEELDLLNQDCISCVRSWLKSESASKKVLISHYPPLRESAEIQWMSYEDLNPIDRESLLLADYTDLESLLTLNNVVSIHGHTHKTKSYISQSGLKVYCNSRGHGLTEANKFQIEHFTL
ncbi:metallophosphoesterase [Vibrio owensii]|uniref:metallophosphoesterase n=1 Tax=Vibrio owensii TaxID=696485 RepID=UPI0018F157E1|nr:metallophosphoesterase [Vibrio owensii]